MDESKQAWMKVGAHFAAVGEKLRAHGEQAAGESSDAQPDQAAVVEALNTLGKALNQTVSSVSGAVKDPGVRDDLKEALNSMGEALNVSFADVGEQVGDKIKNVFARKPSDGETESP